MRTLVGGGGSRWHLGLGPRTPKPKLRRDSGKDHRRSSGHRSFAEDVSFPLVKRGNAALGIYPVVGARVVPIELALGPPADPLVFRVVGSGFADPAQLKSISNEVKRIVNAQPETWNVTDSWGGQRVSSSGQH